MIHSDINTPRGTAGVVEFIGNIDPNGRRELFCLMAVFESSNKLLYSGVTTATAYLTPDVLARPNLTVAINMHVDKIVTKNVEGQGLRAVGVVISTSPTSPIYGVCAKTEVILSAGAVGTPQLLLLSGVGPAAELEKLDIKVVHDSPAVGKNLSDVSLGLAAVCYSNLGLMQRSQSTSAPVLCVSVPNQDTRGITCAARSPARTVFSGSFCSARVRSPRSVFLVPHSCGPITQSTPVHHLLTHPGMKSLILSVLSFDSLPFSSLASPGLPVKDNSSGPGVPDIEVLWAPATVVGPGLQDPPAGSIGLTMVSTSIAISTVSDSVNYLLRSLQSTYVPKALALSL